MTCIYCNSLVPEKGFFCPKCTKQVKCKHCKEELVLDSKICIVCGEEVGQKTTPTNINNIEYFESQTERSFKASVTDGAIQGVSDSLSMILANTMGNKNFMPNSKQISNVHNAVNDAIDTEAEIVNDNEVQSKQNSIHLNSPPTFEEVELKDLAKTETDWLLVYAFEASEGGTKKFMKEDFIRLYEVSKRKNLSRMKNLTQNIRNITTSQYIKSSNGTDGMSFILLEKGKDKVQGIFNDQSTSKPKVITKKKGQNETEKKNSSHKNKNGSSTNFIDLNFTKNDIESLVSFFKDKKPKGQKEEVLVVIKWYKDNKKVNEFSIEEISYLLKISSKKVPKALDQVLINMKGGKYNWIINSNESKIALTSIGESYVTSSLPKS